MRPLLASLLATACASAPAAHADCPTRPAFVQRRFHAHEARGAALVRTHTVLQRRPAIQQLAFTIDGTPGTLPRVDLAPGLEVYRLPPGAKRGEVRGDDGETGVVTVTSLDPAAPLLPAPVLKKVTVRGSAKTSMEGIAIVDGAPPKGAMGIVLTDARGTPLAFHVVRDAREQLVIEHTPCTAWIEGTVAPLHGQEVKVFWVDESGRASALSKSVKAVVST